MLTLSYCYILLLLSFFSTAYSFKARSITKSYSRIQSTSLFMNTEEQLGRVTMYKKVGCPYCIKATELLEGKYKLKVDFVDIESEKR